MATVNTLPLINPLREGYSVSVANIESAVQQSANKVSAMSACSTIVRHEVSAHLIDRFDAIADPSYRR